MFDPKTDRFPYPEYTDRHYLKVNKKYDAEFNAEYPYVDQSKPFERRRRWFRMFLNALVFPVVRVRLGLKIVGRQNLKKHKAELENGVISCCNHVHLWDFLAILRAVRPRHPYVLIWAPNVNGDLGKEMRLVGGIPIPEGGVSATEAMLADAGRLLDAGGWLHVYPEGSMWEYYQPVRPFKRGAAYMACRFGKPVLPMAISYREPGWLRKHIFRQFALFTLNIGEPLYADDSLAGKAREQDLSCRCHEAVCRLAGIAPGDNIYPPLFDNSKRIDYYTTEYGVGYKGSH